MLYRRASIPVLDSVNTSINNVDIVFAFIELISMCNIRLKMALVGLTLGPGLETSGSNRLSSPYIILANIGTTLWNLVCFSSNPIQSIN